MKISSSCLIEWKDAYNIGSGRFDHEHQFLMDAANQILTAQLEQQPAETLAIRFTGLLDLTSAHFDKEDLLMQETSYPNLPQHRASHDRLMRDLVRFSAKARNGQLQESEAGQFLLDWLLEHVLQADLHYTTYSHNRGIA